MSSDSQSQDFVNAFANEFQAQNLEFSGREKGLCLAIEKVHEMWAIQRSLFRIKEWCDNRSERIGDYFRSTIDASSKEIKKRGEFSIDITKFSKPDIMGVFEDIRYLYTLRNAKNGHSWDLDTAFLPENEGKKQIIFRFTRNEKNQLFITSIFLRDIPKPDSK